MQYLTAPELSELLDCQPNQFALMAKRLAVMGWPFTRPPGGCPKVLRAYHDRRLNGLVQASELASNAAEFQPNRAALEELQKHGRRKKAA